MSHCGGHNHQHHQHRSSHNYRPHNTPNQTNVQITNNHSSVSISVNEAQSNTKPPPYSAQSHYVRKSKKQKQYESERRSEREKAKKIGIIVRDGRQTRPCHPDPKNSEKSGKISCYPPHAHQKGRSSDPYHGDANDGETPADRQSRPCQQGLNSDHCNPSHQQSGECTSGCATKSKEAKICVAVPKEKLALKGVFFNNDILSVNPVRPKDIQTQNRWRLRIYQCYSFSTKKIAVDLPEILLEPEDFRESQRVGLAQSNIFEFARGDQSAFKKI